MEIWIWSDLHIGHDFIANLRGYESIEAHDDDLLRKWNQTVKKRDQIWILGDLAMNPNKARDWLPKANGTKFLVYGNHDKGHPMHSGFGSQQRRDMEVFQAVTTIASMKMDGRTVMMSHFPYTVDHVPASRFMEWRARDEGLYLLHGHTHSPWQWSGERQIHVGVDAWREGPVNRDTVAEMIRKNEEPA